MGYFDLKEGKYNKCIVSEEDLWGAFSWLFTKSAANDTSYKFIFLRSLLDCVNDGGLILNFDSIFEKFTYFSWSLVLKHHIRQKARASDGRLTELENILNDYLSAMYRGQYISWGEIDPFEKKKIVSKVKNRCKRYVVGAFYGDTKELVYSFSRNEEWIELNPLMVKFIKENRQILLDLNYNKWSKFYQNRNSEDIKRNIENCIDFSLARKGENIFRYLLAIEFEMIKPKSDESRINTLEILFSAEELESGKNELDPVEAEDELYKDFSNMTEYLKDPVLLLNYLRKREYDKISDRMVRE